MEMYAPAPSPAAMLTAMMERALLHRLESWTLKACLHERLVDQLVVAELTEILKQLNTCRRGTH